VIGGGRVQKNIYWEITQNRIKDPVSSPVTPCSTSSCSRPLLLPSTSSPSSSSSRPRFFPGIYISIIYSSEINATILFRQQNLNPAILDLLAIFYFYKLKLK